MRIKLLILAAFASCLWGVRDLPVQPPRFLYQSPVLNNLADMKAYADRIKSPFQQVCPVYLADPNEAAKLRKFFAAICMDLYPMHFPDCKLDIKLLHEFNTPIKAPLTWYGISVDQICENPIIVNCFNFIRAGLNPHLQRKLFYSKHSHFVEHLTQCPISSESEYISAFALYFAECFGGGLGLFGGTVDRITVDQNVFTIVCKLNNKTSCSLYEKWPNELDI